MVVRLQDWWCAGAGVFNSIKLTGGKLATFVVDDGGVDVDGVDSFWRVEPVGIDGEDGLIVWGSGSDLEGDVIGAVAGGVVGKGFLKVKKIVVLIVKKDGSREAFG